MMQRNPSATITALCVGALLSIGIGCERNRVADSDGDRAGTDRLKVVSVISPQRRELKRTTTQPATVHAFQQAAIYSKLSGYLQVLKTDIGQSVKENATLAVISVPEMQKARDSLEAEVKRLKAVEGRRDAEKKLAAANIRAAEALRDQAKAQIEQSNAQLAADTLERDRVKSLVADMSVAARLLDEAEKRYQASKAVKTAAEALHTSSAAQVDVAGEKLKVAEQIAKAAVQETNVAQKKLDETDELMKYATLKAPFEGIVIERNIDKGDLVRNLQTASNKPHTPLFTVADIRKVRVHVLIPENDAPHVKNGADVSLTLRALPGREFSGKVTRFANQLDSQTQTMLVEIVLDNSKDDDRWVMFPGMYGEATITLARQTKSLVLPAEAIRFDSEGKGSVYVLDAGDVVRVVPVKTGLDFGDEIEIVNGISDTDRVVGAVIGRLTAGQKVTVKK